MRRPRAGVLAAAALLAGGCAGAPSLPEAPAASRPGAPAASPAPGPAAPRSAPAADAQLTNALVDLAESKASFRRDLSGSQGTPLGDILAAGSPVGYDLRNRFLGLGVPLAEAFAANPDPVFRGRLVEMARWDKDGEARAAALIALARAGDLGHLRVINEALVHLNAGVRFGALEALVVWGHPAQALPLLAAASERDPEPLLRVYASAGLARLGDAAGLHRLRAFLDSPSWTAKAMAAKYLGELGTAEDYGLLLGRLDGEAGNDFVVAEYCVAALKLYPKTRKAP